MESSRHQGDAMWVRLFRRVRTRSSTLQGRLRDMVMHAVLERFILPGDPLPSSRVLAQSLGVSRTTVMLALESLVDKGVIEGKPRSGYFVVEGLLSSSLYGDRRGDAGAAQFRTVKEAGDSVSDPADAGEVAVPDEVAWSERLKLMPSQQYNIIKPRDWQRLPYPFVYGQFDASLFPVSDWRECVLEILQPRIVRRWAPDHIDDDDSTLIEQIHRRLLPSRGIWVDRDQILVTSGTQQAIFMLATLLVGPQTRIGIENPGYPDARNNFQLRTRYIRPLAVDDEGLVCGPDLAQCDYVFVTPSHQCPTTVTMSLNRRETLLRYAQQHDFIVLEDDHESELNFSGKPTPALKSLDTAQRVIYMGSLSKTLAHGLRLGFVVASPELIRELRALRRLVMRHVPTNNQYAAASFVGHGHHEAFIHRLNAVYRSRATALRTALTAHAPELVQVPSHGGSALWVEGPAGLDTRALTRSLYAKGVVIEPGDVFFWGDERPTRYMRLGYSSIPETRIDSGVRLLAEELRRAYLLRAIKEELENDPT